MIRTLITAVALIAFIIFGATVPLGSRTLFGHVARIWKAEETQDLVKGVKEKSGPMVDKLKKGAKAGWEAMTDDGGPPTGKDESESDSLRQRAVDEAAERGSKKVGDAAEDLAREEIKERLSGE